MHPQLLDEITRDKSASMENGAESVRGALSVLHREERRQSKKKPKECTQSARKAHMQERKKKKKEVRSYPLSIYGEHEAREQPSQLAVHVAREQQAVRAGVHDQR